MLSIQITTYHVSVAFAAICVFGVILFTPVANAVADELTVVALLSNSHFKLANSLLASVSISGSKSRVPETAAIVTRSRARSSLNYLTARKKHAIFLL